MMTAVALLVACEAFQLPHANFAPQTRGRPATMSVLGDMLRSPLRLFGSKGAGAGGKDGDRHKCGKNKYGCDPRGSEADPRVSDAAAAIRESLNTSFAVATPGEVGLLEGGVEHLRQILAAAGDDRVVILKFKREGCPACGSTIAPLESAAQAFIGRADFLEVDYQASKAFCKQCAIAVVPCAHIYVNGTLEETMPLGPRAWPNFAERLTELLGEPSGEVLAPKIPESKTPAPHDLF